uniref:Uncharacterized protein n=1 Tax=Pyrodinium bahamense TaxID=73915 RepID=A0A7S0AWH8_9DINO|mmetsp:Transcript_43837/g.121809  ORF Transcript_43837/g.121809 Transcript_43837/m.121809 type:complete len:290 (+) Transcript_43837:91-960(+)
MGKVCGLDISDPRQERTAKALLYAQTGILCLSLIYGLVQIILQLKLEEAASEAELFSGETSQRPVGSGAGLSIVQTLFALAIPFALLIFARAAISGNQAEWMMILSVVDACGACCACMGMIGSISAIVLYRWLASWALEYDCTTMDVQDSTYFRDSQSYDSPGYGFSSQTNSTLTAADVARCRSGMEDASGLFHLLANLAIVAAIFGLLDTCLCGFAATQATEANQRLKQNLVFTGPPRPPVQQIYAQPGTAVPANGPVVVGQPVYGQPVVVVGTTQQSTPQRPCIAVG